MPSPSHPMMTSPGMGQVLVGSVVAYAGVIPSAPERAAVALSHIEQNGWMLCDGRTLPVTIYSELFFSLGYAYGGEGESFAIRDYRDVATGLPSVGYLIKFTHGAPRMGSHF